MSTTGKPKEGDANRRCAHSINHFQLVILKDNRGHKASCKYNKKEHYSRCAPCFFLKARNFIDRAKAFVKDQKSMPEMTQQQKWNLFSQVSEDVNAFSFKLLPFWDTILECNGECCTWSSCQHDNLFFFAANVSQKSLPINSITAGTERLLRKSSQLVSKVNVANNRSTDALMKCLEEQLSREVLSSLEFEGETDKEFIRSHVTDEKVVKKCEKFFERRSRLNPDKKRKEIEHWIIQEPHKLFRMLSESGTFPLLTQEAQEHIYSKKSKAECKRANSVQIRSSLWCPYATHATKIN